jgi:hypothetical protein
VIRNKTGRERKVKVLKKSKLGAASHIRIRIKTNRINFKAKMVDGVLTY